MKKFIINLGLFLVVVGLIAVCLDYMITIGLHKRTDYVQEVWNDVLDSTVTPDVIVLGNCVAVHDHNPRILDSVLGVDSYVFAMSNLTFPYHYFMWNMLRKYHRQLPKMVIMALDYSDMSFREAKTNMENEQFLSLMFDKEARHFLRQYGGYSFLDAYVPCYRYFGHKKRIKYGICNSLGIKKFSGKPDHFKGYIGLDDPYDAHREWFTGSYIQPIETEIISMFNSFLLDCRNNGVEVLVVMPPIVYELSDCVDNEEEVYHIYETLAKRHGFKSIRYVAPHWLSMDTMNFESPNHLNKQMSEVYTRDLADFIKNNYSEVFNEYMK